MRKDDIEYKTIRCSALTDEQIEQCKALFDAHYGKWDIASTRNPGGSIKFPKKYYEEYRSMPDSYVALALCDNAIIGQAFYIRKDNEYGKSSWVTQLVVHSDFRRRKIAKTLLVSIWGFSSDYMWGLATSNALTIKTLEAATLRRVRPSEMKKHEEPILLLKSDIPFAKCSEVFISDDLAVIDTDYPVDQQTIADNLKEYSDEWALGQLQLGQEWIAFTFRDQQPDFSDAARNQDFFENSDAIVCNAYDRMSMTSQPWTRYASHEVDFILKQIDTSEVRHVYDIGCGIGRHSLELARKGFNVTGFDYAPKQLSIARKTATDSHLPNLTFETADCRELGDLPVKADLVICLYDVIGTFIDQSDNEKILSCIYRNLRFGGYIALSVMNLELTQNIAIQTVDTIQSNPSALTNLPATNTMQQTGNVFDPKYFLLETSTGIVYRKEQFEHDGELSAEYVIRDKRYTKLEILDLLAKHGFTILEARHVQTGHWDRPLSPTDPRSKEILVIATKK